MDTGSADPEGPSHPQRRVACSHYDSGALTAIPMLKRTNARQIGLTQIHIAVLLAGGAGLFAKFLSVGPLVLTTGRTVFGSLALLACAIAMRTSLRVSNSKDFAALVMSGAILAI